MSKVKRYLPSSSLGIYVKGKYLGIYVKCIYFWGYLPFNQQGYYPFWFEFSQNFVKFRRSASRENVKKLQVNTLRVFTWVFTWVWVNTQVNTELRGKTGKYQVKTQVNTS